MSQNDKRNRSKLCTILETLLTRKDEKTEITYRLKKRIAVLLGHLFPKIETDIRDLYNKRSEFIHGTIFEVIKESGDDFKELIDFEFARRCTMYVRVLILTYIHLHKNLSLFGTENVIELPEKSILDTDLRIRVKEKTDEILELLPPS